MFRIRDRRNGPINLSSRNPAAVIADIKYVNVKNAPKNSACIFYEVNNDPDIMLSTLFLVNRGYAHLNYVVTLQSLGMGDG